MYLGLFLLAITLPLKAGGKGMIRNFDSDRTTSVTLSINGFPSLDTGLR